jgi:hypothetical protein
MSNRHSPAVLTPPPPRKNTGIHLTGGWVDPRDGLDVAGDEKSFYDRNSNSDPFISWSIGYTDYSVVKAYRRGEGSCCPSQHTLIQQPTAGYSVISKKIKSRQLGRPKHVTRRGKKWHAHIYSNIYPTRCNVTQFIYIWKLLYMFRVVLPPIIRSAYNCIYSIWYLSHRYCYLPPPWRSCSNSSTIAADSSNGVINIRCCKYSCMRSWWVEVPPETCRAVFRYK